MDLEGQPAMDREEARLWLEGEFLDMDCEPLRPTGKLLTTDRVVVVAQAAGPAKFADAAWAMAFARATATVLGKPVINIDADALTITY
jgi:hypothetical protein